MKPKYPYPLEKFYSHRIPWDEELFEPRIRDLLDTGNLSNMDRCMLRLRSDQARELGDARFLLKFLEMVLPELFDEKLMREIAKEISQRVDSTNASNSVLPTA
jgi:hypothetical protein